MDFEKRINDIYQRCRKHEEIKVAFDQLQLELSLEIKKHIKALEAERNERRRSLFDAQDNVDKQRGEFIAQIEGKLTQSAKLATLFVLRWRLQ